jgi:two-component system, NarL family, sensor histidine kinase UhpB
MGSDGNRRGGPVSTGGAPAGSGAGTEGRELPEPWGIIEERARLAFDNAPIGMALVGLDYRLHKVNRALCEALGYGERELLDSTFVEITHPDDRGEDLTLAGQLFRGEIPSYRLEKRFVTKDGRLVWLDLTALVVRGGDGEPLYGLAMVEDITARKRAEEALRTSEERYRSFVVNSSEAIWRFEIEQPFETTLPADEQIELLYRHAYLSECNDATARMQGRRRAEDLVGKRLTDLIPAPEPRNLATLHTFIAYGYRIHEAETAIVRPDVGERVLLNSIIGTVASGRLLRVWGVQRDITERRRAERQLEESRSQMRALAAHLQATRERELARVSREVHDALGQPLAALKIVVSWLRRKLPEAAKPPVRDEMEQRFDDATALIAETLTSVKGLAAELRPRVLDTLGLAAAVEWQCQEFERRVSIACECRLPEEELPLGVEKSTALFRILQEALTNVARHSGASRVRVELKAGDDGVSLSVRDNGRGITEAEASALTSLGLLGMHERAALLGGDLTVEGSKGKGTLVVARLPPDDPAAAEVEESP